MHVPCQLRENDGGFLVNLAGSGKETLLLTLMDPPRGQTSAHGFVRPDFEDAQKVRKWIRPNGRARGIRQRDRLPGLTGRSLRNRGDPARKRRDADGLKSRESGRSRVDCH